MTKQSLLDHGEMLAKTEWPDAHSRIVFRTTWNKAVELLWPILAESTGMIKAHEFALRQDAGNTNYECWLKALTTLESKVKGE